MWEVSFVSALGATCVGSVGMSKLFSINPYVIKSKKKKGKKQKKPKQPNNLPKTNKWTKNLKKTNQKTSQPTKQKNMKQQKKISVESGIVLSLSGMLGGTVSM